MIDSAKNVLITGGAKGLGAHLARHLSAQGHQILVLDRTASEDLAADYRETLTEYMTVDLADWSAVHDGIERLLAKHEGA
jgi:NAD(P)-dependent dehydrogenase (short-subunit alcohol dehydrogenase family)